MHAEFMTLKNLAYRNTSLSQYKNIAISSGRAGQKTNLNTKTSRYNNLKGTVPANEVY